MKSLGRFPVLVPLLGAAVGVVLLTVTGRTQPALGPNLIVNGDFSAGLVWSWNPEQHVGAQASFTVTPDLDGKPALRI